MGRIGFALMSAVIAGCSDHGDLLPDAGIDAPPAPPAHLMIAPQTADFGTVSVGIPSPMVVLTVTNAGGSTSGYISAIATGVDAAELVLQNTCTTLAAQGTCIVAASFTATSPGSKVANVVVSGSPGGTVMAMLNAAAVTQPGLEISPATFVFPDQAMNTTGTTTKVFTVTNPSGITTSALIVTPGGIDPSQFVKTADTCAGATLAPSASCSFTVAFHPTTTGLKNAYFDITANPGGVVSAAVSGTGI